MSKYKQQSFTGTFENSYRGIRLVLKSERNIRIHFCVGVLVSIAALLLKFDIVEFCILFLTIGMVIIAESINSAIEFSLDAVFKNKYSKMVGMAKDISAGAVMLATMLSIAIGVLLFGHAILDAIF